MAKIMRTSTNPEFVNLDTVGKGLGETNDCSVKALALITKRPYEEAHAELKRRGRINGQGVLRGVIGIAAAAMGEPLMALPRASLYNIIQSYPKPHFGLKNITSHHPRRFSQVWGSAPDCLFFSKSHVGALIGGEMLDWSVNNALRVIEVYYRERDQEHMDMFIRYCKDQRSKEALAYWMVK